MSCSHTFWVKHHEKWVGKQARNGSRGKCKHGIGFIVYCRTCGSGVRVVPYKTRFIVCREGHRTEIRNGVRQ